MTKELKQYKTLVQLTGILFFDAEDDDKAAEWLTTQEDEVGIALVNIGGQPNQIRNVTVEFIEEREEE